MTEQKNLKLVQDLIAEYSKKEVPLPPPHYLANNVKWTISGSIDDPLVGEYHGPEAVAQVFQLFNELAETEHYEIQDYFTNGDKVVVTGEEKIRFKHSGRTVQDKFAYIYTVRDGKIVEFQAIYGYLSPK